MLAICNLDFSFGYKRIFSSLNVSFPKRRHLLVGDNGVGKTSLFAILGGLYEHSTGCITWRGAPLSQNVRVVALTSALIDLPEFITAQQLIDLHLSQWSAEVKRKPIEADIECCGFELQALIESLNFQPFLTTKVGQLSSGNLQKLRLVLALSRPSQLLLLDEACSAMDKASQAVFYRLVSEYTGHVIAISHEAGGFSEDFVEVRL